MFPEAVIERLKRMSEGDISAELPVMQFVEEEFIQGGIPRHPLHRRSLPCESIITQIET